MGIINGILRIGCILFMAAGLIMTAKAIATDTKNARTDAVSAAINAYIMAAALMKLAII